MPQKVYWFFGYPGVGKDFCAKILSEAAGIDYINADDFLTDDERHALRNGTFTGQDRLQKLKRIADHLQSLLRAGKSVAVADSLPDNISRAFIVNEFKDHIALILVRAPETTHRKRIRERKGHFFTHDLLDAWVKKHWEPVTVAHHALHNDAATKKELRERILDLYHTVNDSVSG